jgi:hypothetical protein
MSSRLQLEHLQSSLKLLPNEDTKDFVEALRRVPLLVELESNPTKFLRRESFDVDAAVKRLAMYWRCRRMIFGDRAFLPMTTDDCGAMQAADISALKKGCIIPLPFDDNGRSIVFIEKTQLHRLPKQVKRRCFFYVSQCLAKNAKSVVDGFVVIWKMEEMKFGETSELLADILAKALPLTLYRHHIFCPLDEESPHCFYARYASQLVSLLGIDGFKKTTLHTATSIDESISMWKALGFQEQSIPVSLGGAMNLEDQVCYLNSSSSDDESREQDSKLPALKINTDISNQLMQHQLLSLGKHSELGSLQYQGATEHVHMTASLPRLLLSSSPHLSIRDDPQSHTFNVGATSSNYPPAVLTRIGNDCVTGQLLQRRGVSLESRGVGNYSVMVFENPPETIENEALQEAARLAVGRSLFSFTGTEKAAYLEAICVAPEVVANESDLLSFARVENFDCPAAARRLLLYWTMRNALFGERAHLPMTQSGYGALTKEDIVVLSSGNVALLPNDSFGRSVLVSDRNRMLDRSDNMLLARMRSIFYLLSTLSEEEINLKEGIVWLDVIVSPRLKDVSVPEVERTVQVMKALPIKVKAVHLIVCPPKTRKQHHIENAVAIAIDTLRASFGKKLNVHSGGSTKEIAEMLKSFGLLENQLPSVMGGKWKYEEFAKWQRVRSQLELTSQQFGDTSIRGTKEASTLSTSEKKERKRMLNVIHSRQKRERRRAEEDTLQKQCNDLEQKNSILRTENSRLEAILAEAVIVIASEI